MKAGVAYPQLWIRVRINERVILVEEVDAYFGYCYG